MKQIFLGPVLFSVLLPLPAWPMTASEYHALNAADLGTVQITQSSAGEKWIWLKSKIEIAQGFFIYMCAATKVDELTAAGMSKDMSVQEIVNMQTPMGWKVVWTTAIPMPTNVPLWCGQQWN